MRVLMEAVTAARHFVDLPTILVAVTTCLLSYMYLQRHRNLPPGPRPWPILGNIPYFMWFKPEFGPAFLTDWSKTYGDVMCFWLASRLHVMISGRDAIRHALVTRADDLSSRRVPPTTAYIRGDGTSE
ncbi:CYP2A6 [Branchiostoma lanceolatum]|uniref:CYP2A6 protein n=1 Tax=Branchiostoma lanceolatum TaxID=7740 RepID=A0A8J9ZR89_BRALA|nr:CYP2A6 [Branchiostoma lanceolatum]